MNNEGAPEPRWEWYRSFLHVAQAGSLSAAARALGLSQPTLGRHIDQLEATLGLRLFTRSPEGFAPTDAGQALLPYAATLATTAAALRRTASGARGGPDGGLRGAVRISASEVMGVEVLPPILAALQRMHPLLKLELVLSNQADDLLRREADIAVRMFRPVQQALLVRRVGAVELGLFAHADYLDARGTPLSVAQLGGHALVGYGQESDFIRGLRRQLPDFAWDRFVFRADSDLAQLAAIRAGLGIGVCQASLAARDARLMRLLPQQFAPRLDTWIAMHGDLRHSSGCQAVFDALADGLAQYLACQPG
nr:LysR family transcriptional regulator [Pulveribacter suum]